MSVSFFAPGIPAPKGSTRSFPNARTGRIVTTGDCNRTKPWQATVGLAAQIAGAKPMPGPIRVRMVFAMPRPKVHFRACGLLKPSAEAYHSKKPDLDKLERAVLDALTGVCWIDDAQVAEVVKAKMYGSECGVTVSVERLAEAG